MDYQVAFLSIIIEDLNKELAFQIYPNPAENKLNVTSANIGNVKFSIYDIYGKKQISGMGSNILNIDISELNPGIYVLSISDNYQIYNFKFLKK